MTNRQLNEDAMIINNSSLDYLLDDIEKLVETLDELPTSEYPEVMNDVFESLLNMVKNSKMGEGRKEEIKERFKKYEED